MHKYRVLAIEEKRYADGRIYNECTFDACFDFEIEVQDWVYRLIKRTASRPYGRNGLLCTIDTYIKVYKYGNDVTREFI